MPTLLITGFGRFPGAAFNPSATLALRAARMRRPALADVKRIGHVFATSYADVDRALPDLLARHRPDAVVMFGLAARAKTLRIETQARNRATPLFPDASGAVPKRGSIVLRGPPALRGRAPFMALRFAARSTGAKTVLSRNAGSYLCNYAYWRALEAAGKSGGPRLVIFVHVPPLSRMPRRDQMRAGEAIVRAAVTAFGHATRRQA